ncbi:TetR/AcrR family transcriptional regulator [Actinoplanes aureus]|uniref:TetR/AcrR family transcriptional regulator n=1 Tax=Actinoplanes aureus TaxID=2792083 RepID=A0A931CCE4_9ACTN|nr:TetR/AcrR family transcriptional regulator [Actinoplanes aureus]MBG0564563.1 TetR/AcrR family transcriptional regulator [Actinoplanes aureus]
MVTTAERGREVRARLLRAATELIVERGWTATTTRVVADRAGVAPGLVHYHFASVQALLREAALDTARGLTAQIGPMLAGTRSAGDTVDLLFRALDGYSGTDPASVLLVEAYLAATRDDQLREALAGVITDFRRELAERLADHGVPGPETTAAVVAAAVDGVMLHRSLLGPERGDTTAVLRRLVRR